jgi:membrane fusion protein, multidrug efflux system
MSSMSQSKTSDEFSALPDGAAATRGFWRIIEWHTASAANLFVQIGSCRMRYLSWRLFVIVAGVVAPIALGLILAQSNSRAQTRAGAPASDSAIAPSVSPPGDKYVDLVGRTEAVQTIEVRTTMPGLLSKIVFREGQEVRVGDLLFEFDARPHQANLDLTRAELARAQAELAGGEADFARQKQLRNTASSEANIDTVAAHVSAAKAAVEAAKAKVQSAQLSLESTRIASPIMGRVGRAYVSAGNWVLPSAILTVIVSQDPIHVSFDMDERQYLKSYRQWGQAGAAATAKPAPIPVKIGLSIEEGFPHEGIIDFIDNRFDSTKGTIRMRALVANADGLILPGLFARVRIPRETSRSP